ncbi:glycosyl hydrolase family 28-related protein [Geodermatophilus sp. CPCC 205506]|uniref:glycosyl hydrolase family 28-related protein n=1 Tax=Geodermatophilus sp. CPCC 205506 TaxID=2936596 RepID=UPI003EEF6DCA
MAWPPITHQDVEDEIAALRSGVFNASAYGAVGDGVTDDTAALQAAIDAACGGPAGLEPSPIRDALGPVYIGPGTYLTTSALVVKAVLGLQIIGAGPRMTRIRVSGTRTEGINVTGCPSIVIRDIGLTGDGTAGTATITGSALALDWMPSRATAWGSHAVLERIFVEDLRFKYGITLGLNSANFDLSDVRVVDCAVAGAWSLGSDDASLYQAAFLSGSGRAGNVLNHQYEHCTGVAVRRLFHVNNVNRVSINGGNGSGADVALYYEGTGVIAYRDARVETSRRLANCQGGNGANPANLVVENIVWSPGTAAAADNTVIRWWAPGTVRLSNLVLEEQADGAVDWLLEFGTAGTTVAQVVVLVDGVITTNATVESLLAVVPGTKCYAEVRGFMPFRNASGLTGTGVGRVAIAYNGASADTGSLTRTT